MAQIGHYTNQKAMCLCRTLGGTLIEPASCRRSWVPGAAITNSLEITQFFAACAAGALAKKKPKHMFVSMFAYMFVSTADNSGNFVSRGGGLPCPYQAAAGLVLLCLQRHCGPNTRLYKHEQGSLHCCGVKTSSSSKPSRSETAACIRLDTVEGTQ